MGKFFSKSVLIAAYKELSHLTDNPAKQGQTQITSGLKYVMALGRFAHAEQHDFNTKDKDEKESFNSYVGEIVALDDGWATSNFFDGFTRQKDFGIGSNLYSAGVVPLSLENPTRTYQYPRRQGSSPLFEVKDGHLLTNTIHPESMAGYLSTPALRASFIVWLCRYYEMPDSATAESVFSELKKLLLTRYSPTLINGLWAPATLSLDAFTHNIDEIFGDTRPSIRREDIDPGIVESKTVFDPSGISKPYNWIFFGAPGTGKSHQLDELAQKTFSEKNIRRVTLYPDYTYSQFVGGYKPSPLYDKNGHPTNEITYRYIPGPFMLTYIQAVQNPSEPYLLIIEEINRANPAAVFGDVFQLLDRNEKGRSVYEITVPREMEDHLRIHLPEYATTAHISNPEQLLAEQTRLDEETKRLTLPSNMYIWATMNSADQGVYPMDTAFKRRWDFKYIGINDGAKAVIDGVALSEIEVPCGSQTVKWNDLRVAINNFLLTDSIHVNEDKLLGPFFIAPASLAPEKFTQVFENKVLMYLYEDAGKSKRSRLFRSDLKTYSQICDAFETEGVAIFGDGFVAPKPCAKKQADADDADTSEE